MRFVDCVGGILVAFRVSLLIIESTCWSWLYTSCINDFKYSLKTLSLVQKFVKSCSVIFPKFGVDIIGISNRTSKFVVFVIRFNGSFWNNTVCTYEIGNKRVFSFIWVEIRSFSFRSDDCPSKTGSILRTSFAGSFFNEHAPLNAVCSLLCRASAYNFFCCSAILF